MKMDSTLNQPYILLATMYGGMIAGLVYDLFRVFRKKSGTSKLWTAIIDSFFVIVLFLVVSIVLYYAVDLAIRPYNFIGIGLGGAIYLSAVSPILRLIYKKIREITVDRIAKKRSNK